MITLYHYVHCPFCVRVRMAFGHLKVPYKSVVVPYDDEKTPLDLCQKKMLPIIKWKDGKAQNESLEIIEKADQENKLQMDLLKDDAERTYNNYELMLNERFDGTTIDENKRGLARELARMNLTLNTYTQWYWKTDLLNLMNFLRLRADSHAQYEIRAYADVMLDSLKKWVPITFEAFMDYRVGGTEVSSKGKIVIQKLVQGQNIKAEDSGLSKREWNELMNAFNFTDKLI